MAIIDRLSVANVLQPIDPPDIGLILKEHARMTSQYPFSDDDVQKAFDQLSVTLFDVQRDFDPDGHQLPSPKILIVAGAQGSGKTFLLEKTLLPSGAYENYVRLYLPAFRELHPSYAQMQAQGVLHVYEHTEKFIWALGEKVFAYAFANKYNIIMESALDNIEFARFPPAATAAGYRFEVHMIACQKELSHWATLDRVVKSIATSELERVVSLTQIEEAQFNAKAILDAFENACTQVPGSEITLYQRDLPTNMERQVLCHSTCDSYAELTPQADFKGQPFAQVPHLGVKFGILRNAQANSPCAYLQYAQVVHAGLISEAVRQKMVQKCCATLAKAHPLMPAIPAEVFRALSMYVLKYVHP